MLALGRHVFSVLGWFLLNKLTINYGPPINPKFTTGRPNCVPTKDHAVVFTGNVYIHLGYLLLAPWGKYVYISIANITAT